MTNKLVSIGFAAKQLGVSVGSLLRWENLGQVTPTLVTPGGHRRYNILDLRAQLESAMMSKICDLCGGTFKTKYPQTKHCQSCHDPKPCICGCGELSRTPGKRYAARHYHPVKDQAAKSQRHSEVMSAKGDNHASKRPEVRAKISATHSAMGESHWAKRPSTRAKQVQARKRWVGIHPSNFSSAKLKAVATKKLRGNHRHTLAARQKMSASRIAMGDNMPVKRIDVRAKLSLRFRAAHLKQSGVEAMLGAKLDPAMFVYAGLDRKRAYGQPISADFIAIRARLIIEVDGCFWHECPIHGKGRFPMKPAKDASLTKYAEGQGWVVLRFWEHDIKNDLTRVIDEVNQTCDDLISKANQ